MDQIASDVDELDPDAQRRFGVREIDDRLRDLWKQRYPTERTISGEQAYEYFRACADEIYKALKIHAAAYSAHKWIWYLRRIPDTVFQFNTFSNPEYDRAVAESAAGLFGSATSTIPQSYEVQKTTVRQVLRFCGMCLHLSDVFGAMQWAGAGLDFEFRARPIPDPVATKDDEEAVRLYRSRLDAEYPIFARLGVITGLGAPQTTPLLIAPLFRACPPEELLLQKVKFPFDDSVLARYRPLFVAVDDVLAFLSDPTLREQPFAPSVAALLLLHRVMLALAFVHVAYPAQMLLFGFCHVPLADFKMAADHICADLSVRLQVLPTSIRRPGNADELLEELETLTPVMQPLATGPVIIRAGDVLSVDLAAATQRLYADLEAPTTTGDVSNYRSAYFELGVQGMIDRTPRAPSPAYRELRGRSLRLGGAAITDVDAIAETETHILLVSCKSIPYSSKYDMGDYRTVRNVRSLIEKEVPTHQAKVAKLNANPRGDNYQFDKPIIGVVCTPHAVVVTIGVATAEVLPGLRAAVSASELGRWCQAAGA